MASDAEGRPENDDKGDISAGNIAASDKDTATKRRTKTGCLTCRKRRIKCGEERPICRNCIKSKRECAGYNQPLIYKQHPQPHTHPISLPNPGAEYRWGHSQGQPSNIVTASQRGDGNQHLAQPTLPTSTRLFWNETTGWQTTDFSHAPGQTVIQGGDHVNHWTNPQSYQWIDGSIGSLPTERLPGAPHAADTEVVPANGTRPAVVLTPQTSISTDNEQSLRTPGSSSTDTRYSSLGFIQGPRATSSFQSVSDGPHPGNTASRPGAGDEDLDDPWDIDMDDEPHKIQGFHNSSPSSINLGKTSAPAGSRSMSDHDLSRGMVLRQNPTVSSPLLDERSQKLFRHFMSVTGPCMGLFERQDYSTPGAPPRTMWTESLPALALNHSALAHAILAISAMHMFKLDIGSENVATKHFMCALRRVGGAVGHPDQRLEVSTLATVLLLGYYEVLAGDHSRWNLHLSGAGKLIMEHNYAGMMRTIRRMRSRANANITQKWAQEHPITPPEYTGVTSAQSKTSDDTDWMVDQKVISKLTGYEVDYDTQVQPEFNAEVSLPDFDQSSFADWRILTELYWWYCKQDIFMSLLSGDPLILPYTQWKFCPPRGPLNNPERVNTSFDHLLLILARLTDFGGRDRRRKQRAVQSQGGQWIPPAGFLEAKPPSPPNTSLLGPETAPQTANETSRRPNANEGRARRTKPSGASPTQLNFYGMMPPGDRSVYMPSSFNAMNAELGGGQGPASVDPESSETNDMDAQTRYALEEHAAITAAFDLFESELGPEYQPLAVSDIQITTPFGPALQYRSHIIATLWTFFIMGRILLRRMHPHSPPAALISAGVNAAVTHGYAQTIGRICGGLFAQHSYLLQVGHIDHVLSSAVMEVTFSLLFAAVQYHDPVQRGWTIGKLSEIAQVTGWQTSAAVAAACESMWERAGIMGKGPPYQRTMDRNHPDHRLNGSYRFGQNHLTQAGQMSPAEEHESRFVSHDRNLIDKYASTRAHWAIGLLSVEDDLQKISLKEQQR